MQNTIVIFGATGDLTSRKLVPALYGLFRKGRLPVGTRIVGTARSPLTSESWREKLAQTTAQFAAKEFDSATWQKFAQAVFYQPGDITRAEDFVTLCKYLDELEGNEASTRLYYLATSPEFYEEAVTHLGESCMATENKGQRRLVIEKPFGTDLASAQRLNAIIHPVFSEKQVYRIDHYLGKETVQNILVLRFANTIFEPVWNRTYVDHVQITVAEEVLVGRRGGYYDKAGILRDMFQNHLLQLMMITAMEAPVRFNADYVRNEKVKVLQAIRCMTAEDVARDTLRGQYRGYRSEPDVAPDSQTATFAVVKLSIDDWRWQGVPFYLRSGKGMSCRTTQIVIQFREPPYMLFADALKRDFKANRLVIQIQPDEGMELHFLTKVPDAGMQLRMTDFDFSFQKEFSGEMPDSYQRLLMDALAGDASLFIRADEVELAWGIIDPIIDAWEKTKKPELLIYDPGEWGPQQANEWMHAQGHYWFDSCPNFSE